MGRTPSCRGDGLSDEALALRALKPVKRPADWGAELPEDPILCSQAPPAVLTGLDKPKPPNSVSAKVWRVAADARNKGAKRPRMTAKSRSVKSFSDSPPVVAHHLDMQAVSCNALDDERRDEPREGLEGPKKQCQYNILAALGIPHKGQDSWTEVQGAKPPKLQEQVTAPKARKKQVRSKGQHPARDLLRQFALLAPSRSKSKDAVEGTVEERTDSHSEEVASALHGKAFQVRLKTISGNVKVAFSGAAARAFYRSLGLQRGGRVRLQGFTSTRENDVEVLRFKDVHPGVSIKVVATAAMSLEGEEVLHLQDLEGHLAKVKRGEAKAVVSVQALAGRVGKLERQELALQPGEFVPTRTIQLQCPSSNLACAWRLWDAQAEKFGAELQGQQLVINGARLREARGEAELTGCAGSSDETSNADGGKRPCSLAMSEFMEMAFIAAEQEDEAMARRMMLEEMASFGLAGPSSSSSSSSRRLIPDTSAITLRAVCPACGEAQQFRPPPHSTGVLSIRCNRCHEQFQASIPQQAAGENGLLRERPALQFCRRCGTLNTFPASATGQPHRVSCGNCGNVTEFEPRRARGALGGAQRSEGQRALLEAIFNDRQLMQSMNGPVVRIPMDGQRQAIPLALLAALMAAADAEKSNPARRTDVALLPTRKLENLDHLGDQTKCLVCLEEFADGDEVKTLPCLHFYHQRCVDQWLATDNSCPVCKTPIDQPEDPPS
ncbi:RNF167 [Symbiodinium sp. CCMP2456]|nr:RNF167 [Symbiodinium sp. CCMP2456]